MLTRSLAATLAITSALAIVALTATQQAHAVLVSRYTYDLSNANDSVGTNNGADVGSPSYVFDATRGSIVLDMPGTNADYASVPASASLNFGTGSRTVATWARLDSFGNSDGVFHMGSTGPDATDFSLESTGTAGQLRFNGWNRDFTFSFTNPNDWHHFAITYSGSAVTAYVDGVATGVGNYNDLNTGNNGLRLGGPRMNGSASGIDGALDDTLVYDTALAQNQIAFIAGGGDPTNLPAATVPEKINWDWNAGSGLQGWTVLNGEAHLRNGDGDGVTPGDGGGGFAHDGAHETMVIESPTFYFNGDTLNGLDAIMATMAGGAGDQDGNIGGGDYDNLADVLAFNGGNSASTGVKALAFLDLNTNQYITYMLNPSNGGIDTLNLTLTDLTNAGIQLNTPYKLHYFETDDGGWGWGQLNSVMVAGIEGLPPSGTAPEPSALILVLLGLVGLVSIRRTRVRQVSTTSLALANALTTRKRTGSFLTVVVVMTTALVLSVTSANAALVGHWTFDADSLVNSGTTGSVHDGTSQNGSVSYSSDTPFGSGRSLDLTLNDSFVQISNSASSDGGYLPTFDSGLQSGFTISAWAKGLPDGDWDPYVAKNGEGNHGYQLRRYSNTTTNTLTLRGTAGAPDPAGTVSTNDGEWHLITGTWDSGTGLRTLYIDGVLDNQIAGDTGTFGAPTGEHLLFGNREVSPNGTLQSSYPHVLLDDVRIYDTALSASEVQALLNPNSASAPEPSTLVLLGLGVIGLAGTRRRRARK